MTDGGIDKEPEYDQVTEASMNGIYVKAQELDRGHNAQAAPDLRPPGSVDADSHASSHVSSHASSRASDEDADAETAASTHASDAESHASGRGHDD